MNGKRKLIFSLVVFLCCCALVLLDKMPSDTLSSIVSWIFTAFVGGNVGEHIADAAKAYFPKTDKNV